MLILDTNVISEMMKPVPNDFVRAWLNVQISESLYITSITWAELMKGLESMPDGQRKIGLFVALHALRIQIFEDRVLPFDEAAATHYGKLTVVTQRAGQTIGEPDAQIAAIAFDQRMTVVSRDTTPFQAAGLKVINPWESS